MGEVFLARDLSTGHECALKRLYRSPGGPGESLRREFEALTRLRHPTIVSVLELASTFDGTPYLVMEYVAGRPADQAIARGDWTSLCALAARVSEGLDALHCAGVVHGDLKPSNILVASAASDDDLMDVRLVDFGLAALRERGEGGRRGTPGFAAPEVVAGGDQTPAADLYGLGASLFALMTGRPPFDTDHPNTVFEQQRTGPPRAHALEEAGAPWALIELVLRLLAPEPVERPRDAREVRREIERQCPVVRRSLGQQLGSARLVGRERELARLEQWITQATGRPRITFVEGEPGSGVSALLLELASRATLSGRLVCRISCAAHGDHGAVAKTVLRVIAARCGSGGVPEALARRLDSNVPPGEQGLADWVAASAEIAATALREMDLLVLLDDADRLDEWSASWMRRLALQVPALPIRWVLGRSSSANSEKDRVLAESGIAQRFQLAPLSQTDVSRLVTTRLGADAPPQIVDYLWREGAGHPGFTVDLLRLLVTRDALVESDHGLIVRSEVLANQPPPESFVLARRQRLETLAPGARRLMAVLAICGPSLDREDWKLLAAGADDAVVDELVAEGFVRREPDGKLLLSSPSLTSHFEAAISAEERAELQRAALLLPGTTPRQRFAHLVALGEPAAALDEAERAFAMNPETDLAITAAAVAAPLDPALAAVWHERAAELHRDRGHYALAIPHLRAALQHEADPARRSATWVLLSTATLRSGDPERAASVVAEALEELRDDDVVSRLLSNRAACRTLLGDGPGAEIDAREASALAERAGDPVGQGMAADVFVRLALGAGQIDEAERWAHVSADAYQAAANVPGTIRALGARASLARVRGALPLAEKLSREAVDAARRHGNRLPLTEQLVKLAAVLVEAGWWPAAQAAFAEALRIAIEDGRSIEAAGAMAHLAQIEGMLGQTRAARRDARRAIRMTARHQPSLLPYAWRSLAQAQRSAGRFGLALAAARRAQSLAAEDNSAESRWCRIEYGRSLAGLGRWSEAEAIWNARPHDDPERLGPEGVLLQVFSGRAALRRADLERAQAMCAAADSWQPRSRSPLIAAHLELLNAEMAFGRGWIREGLAHANSAFHGFAELPAPADRARAALEIAELVPATPETREAVAAWLDDAARIFERLGDRRGRERALSLAVDWLRRPLPATVVTRDQGLLERVCWLLNSLTDLDELMRRAMRAAVEQLGAERGVLLLADRNTGELEPTAEFGAIEPITRSEAIGYSRRVVKHVTAGGDSVLIEDAYSDPRAASDSIANMKLCSILCVPLFVEGNAVGAVYLDDSRRTHAFAEADRGMIEGFAHLMAVAIEKSRSHDAVRQENERLEGENLSLRREFGSRIRWPGVVGSSSQMQRIFTMVEHAARTNTTVLVTGENGTGKELIARTLHRMGKRSGGPFVEVNCGAIPETLLESELFGILGNVATGVRARTGKFLQANGGTLFLDEIGDMPLSQQVALLSVIANRVVTPLGGSKPIPVDIRIITATNRDLRRLVEAGTFREDLYFRLNVIEINVPPLRERKADIPELARRFLETFAQQQEREMPRLSPDFFAVLMRSDWPGNVRELQNYIERLLAMTPESYLRPDPPPRDVEMNASRPRVLHRHRLSEAVGDIERRMLVDALERASGNQSRAARELGLTEQSVRYRMKKYGLDPRRNQRIRRN